MRAITFLLRVVYAHGLADANGDTCTNDVCMLQLHKSNAAKSGPGNRVVETTSTEDHKSQGHENKTGLRSREPNDDIGHSPVSKVVSKGEGRTADRVGVSKSAGGSHAGLTSISSVSATDSFHSDQCQRFYLDPAPPGYPWGAGAYDDTTNMFRPAAEILASGTVKTWPTVEFKRLVTYEDVATPADFHGSVTYKEKNHCMHYAVRTPQRPVKTMAGVGHNGRSFAMPSVWKSGSTSFNRMLKQSTTDFHHEHSHNERSPSCDGPFELRQCDVHSSFDSSGAEVMFAAVRDPLDRFISMIHEHHEFQSCGTRACEKDVELGKTLAAQLLAEFPYMMKPYMTCEHATQSYLLSGTDINGDPMNFERIFRLESLQEGLHEMETMLGQTFDVEHRNSKDAAAKKLLYDAVFSDPVALCAICKVYAQDFACFGYTMPENCTEEQCASVGVILKSSSP